MSSKENMSVAVYHSKGVMGKVYRSVYTASSYSIVIHLKRRSAVRMSVEIAALFPSIDIGKLYIHLACKFSLTFSKSSFMQLEERSCGIWKPF